MLHHKEQLEKPPKLPLRRCGAHRAHLRMYMDSYSVMVGRI